MNGGNRSSSEQGRDRRSFAFGRNWKNFLGSLTTDQTQKAQASLCRMLGRPNLSGLTFLDAGCGSGLFSLAAIRLGAKEVVSFDVDPESVDCARYLSKRYGPFPQWKILRASVLDDATLRRLGKYDIVYSWGVLHHTGKMWKALENITEPVVDGGLLFISIYNDQGSRTVFWRVVKRLYNLSPRFVKLFLAGGYYMFVILVKTIKHVTRFRLDDHGDQRGMSIWHDAVDWMGGYPFEAAKPDDVISFFSGHGFKLKRLKTRRGHGCNEYVFLKTRT